MKNLKRLLNKNLATKPNKAFIAAFVALSFLGFLVSVYLTAEHYSGGVPPCSLASGCEVVTTSEYSTFLGVPIALFGAVYFLALVILFLAYLDSKKDILLKLAFLLLIPGAGMALALIALQAFVIGAFCIYCLTADISSLIMFIGMLRIFWYTESR